MALLSQFFQLPPHWIPAPHTRHSRTGRILPNRRSTAPTQLHGFGLGCPFTLREIEGRTDSRDHGKVSAGGNLRPQRRQRLVPLSSPRRNDPALTPAAPTTSAATERACGIPLRQLQPYQAISWAFLGQPATDIGTSLGPTAVPLSYGMSPNGSKCLNRKKVPLAYPGCGVHPGSTGLAA